MRGLSFAACGLAFLVVVFGAFVRLSDAGLGCPDWPGCYGHMSVPQSESALRQAQERFPGSVVEGRKAWIEMIHRYLAGALGILVVTIAALAWRQRTRGGRSPALPTFLVALITVQALFGMWTVTLRLMPIIVTLHLLGGMATLALLGWWAATQSRSMAHGPQSGSRLSTWGWLGLTILFAQIALGGWVSSNYAGMACSDVPRCHGQWLPEMDFAHGFSLWRKLGLTAAGTPLSNDALNAIQWSHRLGALVAVAYLFALGLLAAREAHASFWGRVLVALVLLQAAAGIGNVVLVLPLWLAVAHNAGAASLLLALVMLNFRLTLAYARQPAAL